MLSRGELLRAFCAGAGPWNALVAKLAGSKALTVIDFSGQDFGGADYPRAISGYHFPLPTIFDGASFPAGFAFDDAKFAHRVTFAQVTFQGDVKFNGTTFQDVEFAAQFNGQARFRKTKFQGNCTIRSRFCALRFQPDYVVGEACFDGSQFTQHADFSEAVFQSGASFRGPLAFESDANFSKVTFGADAIFDECIFQGEAVFVDAIFASRASFMGTRFAKRADFSGSEIAENMEFHEAWFNRAVFVEHSYFLKRRFTRNTNFDGAKFAYPPQFYDSTLHYDTSFEGTEFGQTSDSNDERAFRTLKQQMSDHQNHVQEMIFFAKEMKSRHAALKKVRSALESRWERCKSRWTGMLISLYKWLSDFGQSVGRPAGALLLMLLVCFVLYAQSAVGWHALSDCIEHWDTCGVRMDRSMGAQVMRFTLAQSVPFGSLFKETHGLFVDAAPIEVQVIAVAQALLTILFAFLIGIGLRNLFRLR